MKRESSAGSLTARLCLYEREGLLKPSRTEGNTRLYSEEDLEQLETILSLTRDLGVNLAGVEIILNMRRRMEQMQREMQEGERPEGVPATEIIVLHDPEAEQSLAIVFFENEDDYKRGDETLSAMPAGDTPGRRASVKKYDVAVRMTA